MEKFTNRNFRHIILCNNDVSTLLPVYLQFLDDDVIWFNEQAMAFYDEIVQLLSDNFSNILQQAQKKSGKFERINGENIILLYTIKENFQVLSTGLIYDGTADCPGMIRVAGFMLDPVWVFKRDPDNPYAPLPIDVATSNMQITDYFHAAK